MQLDADGLGALVNGRPAVRVFAELVAPQNLLDDLGEVFDRRQFRHQHDLAGVAEANDVLLDPQRVQLLLFGVPVGTDALEDRGAV